MGPLATRRTLNRYRCRLAAIAAVLACATAVAAHHGAIAVGHAHHEMDVGTAMELCLAAFTAVGAGVIAVVIGLIALGRWRSSPSLARTALWWSSRSPLPRARAGPAVLSLICVSRR